MIDERLADTLRMLFKLVLYVSFRHVWLARERHMQRQVAKSLLRFKVLAVNEVMLGRATAEEQQHLCSGDPLLAGSHAIAQEAQKGSESGSCSDTHNWNRGITR